MKATLTFEETYTRQIVNKINITADDTLNLQSPQLERNARDKRHHGGDSANGRTPIWELCSVMNSFHFLKGSNSCTVKANPGGKAKSIPSDRFTQPHTKPCHSKAKITKTGHQLRGFPLELSQHSLP